MAGSGEVVRLFMEMKQTKGQLAGLSGGHAGALGGPSRGQERAGWTLRPALW